MHTSEKFIKKKSFLKTEDAISDFTGSQMLRLLTLAISRDNQKEKLKAKQIPKKNDKEDWPFFMFEIVANASAVIWNV